MTPTFERRGWHYIWQGYSGSKKVRAMTPTPTPLEDATDWSLIGPLYRGRIIELEARIAELEAELTTMKQRSITIERCAKWLEYNYPSAKTIAIEMRRALKDKP